jgi:hypothetical protein
MAGIMRFMNAPAVNTKIRRSEEAKKGMSRCAAFGGVPYKITQSE